jgi:Holliday junction resolvase
MAVKPAWLRKTDNTDSRSWERTRSLLGAHPYAVLFAVAFIVRVLVALVVARFFSGSLVLDDATYWGMARDVAHGQTAGWTEYFQELYASTLAFTFPLSLIYRLFGVQIAGQIFVAILGAGTAVMVVILAKDVLPRGVAIATGFVIALLPSQILWSSLILKDAAVWLVLVGLAVAIARVGRAETTKSIVLWGAVIALTLLALGFLRDHTLVVASWALVIAAWAGTRETRYQRIAAALLLAVCIPWVTGLGPGGASFVASAGSINQLRAENADNAASAIIPANQGLVRTELEKSRAAAAELKVVKERITEVIVFLQKRADGTANVSAKKQAEAQRLLGLFMAKAQAIDQQITVTAGAEQQATERLSEIEGAERQSGVRHLVRGISVMLAEPYPWDPGSSPSFRMAQAETLVWYPILLLALLGLLPALKALRVTLFPLMLGGGMLLLYALVEGNVGTAYRHRGEFVWVIVLFAGFGWMELLRMVRNRRARRTGGAGVETT